jgi:ElaB/YqjD/DUF883 family membrane-anchored ribosome-binding protein
MAPDTARVSINGGGLGKLQDMMAPVKEHIEDSARDLARALGKAGESVKQIRMADVAVLMRRSPLAALAVAAGIGFLVGLSLWARDE